jgi:MFS family permease
MNLQRATTKSTAPGSIGRPIANAWIYWILANALGHIAGFSAFGIASLYINWGATADAAASVMDLTVPFAILGLFDGLFVGLAQGLVLQYFTGRRIVGEWVAFTTLGGIAAWVLGPIMGGLAIFIIWVLFYIVAGAIGGFVFGYAQRPTMLRNVDPESGWIVPNMIAGAVGVTVAIAFSSLWGGIGNASGIGGGVEVIIMSVGLGGLVYGAITARTLMRMLDYYTARAAYGSDEPTDDVSKLPVR